MPITDTPPVLTPDALVCCKEDLLSADVDGETILMSIERGNYYGMAETANDIWGRLARPVRVADLCAALAADYDAPADRIRADVLSFLARLAEEGLLTVRAG